MSQVFIRVLAEGTDTAYAPSPHIEVISIDALASVISIEFDVYLLI
jgi:hypothetical protein